MGTTTTLGQLLKCLCHNTQWKYAVFWKLEQTELTWEDCYLDNQSSGRFLCGKSGIISFGCQGDAKRGESMKSPIEMAVANLSCHSYLLGEGIVGQVALERKHRWTHADAVDSALQAVFPGEWNQQFAAGIKTIVLVPIIPFGVLQFGSLDMVSEDLREITRIRSYFGTSQNTPGTCISLSSKMDQLDSYSRLITSSVIGPDTGLYTDESNWHSTFKNLLADHIEEPPQLDVSVHDLADMSSFHQLEDKLNVFPSVSYNILSRDPTMTDPCVKDMEHRADGQDFRREFNEEINSIADHTYLTFPCDSELHKALGLNPKGHDDCMWDTPISGTDEWSNSLAYCQIELPEAFSPLFGGNGGFFAKERRTEQLLDAVTAELLDIPGDNEPYASEYISSSTYVRSCSNSPSKCSDSCLTQCNTGDDAFDVGELVSHKTEDNLLGLGGSMSSSHDSSMLGFDDVVFTGSAARYCDKSISKMQVSQQEQMASELCEIKTTKISRKRSNAANICRPKPRDRQLIQERIKELRQLIPDGSKCSIDALLDRTIKHMRFLQSVPSQTEKLRHSAQSKVNGESLNSSGWNAAQNGASWAYELGCKPEQCPLIVENLDIPGQILVEMQCKDYSLFLDTAQVINRLRLTIIKGILENKCNNLRAHFIIEAPRGFHRMDILWPLVQLLQRNNIPITKMF